MGCVVRLSYQLLLSLRATPRSSEYAPCSTITDAFSGLRRHRTRMRSYYLTALSIAQPILEVAPSQLAEQLLARLPDDASPHITAIRSRAHRSEAWRSVATAAPRQLHRTRTRRPPRLRRLRGHADRRHVFRRWFPNHHRRREEGLSTGRHASPRDYREARRPRSGSDRPCRDG